MAGILLLLVLAFVAGHATSLTGEVRSDGFTLAVVRRDAIVIPFATYDGKRWKNAWPRPEAKVTTPISVADIPRRWWAGRDPASRWTFWPIQGPSRTIDTTGTTWFPTHCHQMVGLRTTYKAVGPVPPLHVQPFPKDGLAVAGEASITPIEIVDVATSTIAQSLATELAEQVSAEETQQITRHIHNAVRTWSHPYNAAERKDTPIRMEALYRVAQGLGDRDVYYFEGVKHYAMRTPPTAKASAGAGAGTGTALRRDTGRDPQTPGEARKLGDPQRPGDAQKSGDGQKASDPQKPGAAKERCDLVTFVSGWVARRGDEKTKPLQVNVLVTSCDFNAAFIMLPLGVVHVEQKPLWVVQWSGWTHERYVVLDIQEDRVATVAWAEGGTCQRE